MINGRGRRESGGRARRGRLGRCRRFRRKGERDVAAAGAAHAEHAVLFPRDHALRLDVDVFLGAGLVDALDHVVGRRERRLDILVANAGLGDELDRDECIGVDLLEVEDQLREILDRVNVVVRRR